MRRILPVVVLGMWLCTITKPGNAQSTVLQRDTVTRLLRLSEDDDFINIWGTGTDDAYTNGTRIDYFFKSAHPPIFLDRWMPRAGGNSTDIYGWGAMQLMYTPDDITNPDYQPDDYPWSGALVATHTRYSYNPVKKYDLQTELVLGVIGPAALDAQAQSLVHKVINYYHPMGWSHQFRNDLLVNINFTAEKQLLSAGSFLTVIGGGQLSAGTMQNSATVYPLLLIGKKDPYFNGFLGQYTSSGREKGKKRWQAYLFAKPEMQLFLTNALIQGGLFTTNPNLQPQKAAAKVAADVTEGYGFVTGGQTSTTSEPAPSTGGSAATTKQSLPQPYPPLQHWVGAFSYGTIASYGHMGFSFSQNISAATLKGLYCHIYGNISLYYGW